MITMITIGGYKFPSPLFVTSDHIYFLPVEKTGKTEDQVFLCGLDDYIQQNIGIIQYIHFPEEDREVLKEGAPIFSVETEKWLGHFVVPFPI